MEASCKYNQELRVAMAAVQQAARLSQHILSHAQHNKQQNADSSLPPVPQQEDMGVVSKDDLSPVTIADFAIQALLTCTLHHAFPTDRFVGEESAAALRENPVLLNRVWDSLQFVAASKADDDNDDHDVVVRTPSSAEEMCDMIDWCGNGQPADHARVWVFDPIDGTENFVKGLLYAINVALLDAGRQRLSVIGCPNMSVDIAFPATDASLDPAGEGALAYGVRGQGAFVRTLHGAPIPAGDDVLAEGERSGSRRLPRYADADADADTATTTVTALRCLTATSVDSGLHKVHAAVADRLGVAYPGNDLLPWVLRWLLLALGVGHATWWLYLSRDRLGKIWDHAGAMLLFEEVGGKITDVDGRDISLVAGRKMVANYGFVAAPAPWHGQVLRAVNDVLAEQKP